MEDVLGRLLEGYWQLWPFVLVHGLIGLYLVYYYYRAHDFLEQGHRTVDEIALESKEEIIERLRKVDGGGTSGNRAAVARVVGSAFSATLQTARTAQFTDVGYQIGNVLGHVRARANAITTAANLFLISGVLGTLVGMTRIMNHGADSAEILQKAMPAFGVTVFGIVFASIALMLAQNLRRRLPSFEIALKLQLERYLNLNQDDLEGHVTRVLAKSINQIQEAIGNQFVQVQESKKTLQQATESLTAILQHSGGFAASLKAMGDNVKRLNGLVSDSMGHLEERWNETKHRDKEAWEAQTDAWEAQKKGWEEQTYALTKLVTQQQTSLAAAETSLRTKADDAIKQAVEASQGIVSEVKRGLRDASTEFQRELGAVAEKATEVTRGIGVAWEEVRKAAEAGFAAQTDALRQVSDSVVSAIRQSSSIVDGAVQGSAQIVEDVRTRITDVMGETTPAILSNMATVVGKTGEMTGAFLTATSDTKDRFVSVMNTMEGEVRSLVRNYQDRGTELEKTLRGQLETQGAFLREQVKALLNEHGSDFKSAADSFRRAATEFKDASEKLVPALRAVRAATEPQHTPAQPVRHENLPAIMPPPSYPSVASPVVAVPEIDLRSPDYGSTGTHTSPAATDLPKSTWSVAEPVGIPYGTKEAEVPPHAGTPEPAGGVVRSEPVPSASAEAAEPIPTSPVNLWQSSPKTSEPSGTSVPEQRVQEMPRAPETTASPAVTSSQTTRVGWWQRWRRT